MQNKLELLALFIEKSKYTIEELVLESNINKEKLLNNLAFLVNKNYLRLKKDNYHLRPGLKVGTIDLKEKGAFLIATGKDIYIENNKLSNALDSDIVLVTVKNDYGKVIEIVKRKEHKIVCEVVKKGNKYSLSVKGNMRFLVYLNNYHNLLNGDVIEVLITEYKHNHLIGKLINKIGHITDPDIDILTIINANGFPYKHSEETLIEAENLSREISKEERLFLNNNIVTIDGIDAKDLDDAISLRKEDDYYYLDIHIADVSNYVVENSNLDKDAFKKGTSAYLADRVIPMLPRRLSNDLCSLNENEERYALSLLIKLDNDANVVDYQIKETVIVVKKRLDYDTVNLFLENKYSFNDELTTMLNLMYELSLKLFQIRKKAGSLDFVSKEYQYILNDKHEIIDIKLKKQGKSERIIEAFMILANEIVSTHFSSLSLPSLYRTHDKPDQEKIKNLFQELNNLGVKTPRINHLTPLALQKFMDDVKDNPLEEYINDLILKSMAKAKYETFNRGHYGLSLKNYTHFTAPIRRYPDLMIHRLIKDLIIHPSNLTKKISHYEKINDEIAKQSSVMERKAESLSREVDKFMITKYMEKYLNYEFEGIISGMIQAGMFVRIDKGIEGMIPFRLLNDYFNFDEKNLTVTNVSKGTVYKFGDKIKVKLVDVNVGLRQITFTLL